MKSGTRGQRKATPEPAPIPPMNSAELEAIGLRLFGRVGWTVKIARIVGKDSSTLRRWRAGSPIESVYAKMIRDYADTVDPSAPSWDSNLQSTPDALDALRLIARVQAMKRAGAPVSIRVDDADNRLELTLSIADRQPVIAWQDRDGSFQALECLDAELSGMWKDTMPRC
jgi:hypothetical protein